MRSEIAAALKGWQRDPMIYAIVIDAEGERAFCAGGDLHELHRLASTDRNAARVSLGGEYALNWQIECYTKPIISLIDGICMGSGVGLTAFGTHRAAGPAYAFAMPETAVGFFPDAGATWLLSRLRDNAGIYLGLSGRAIGRGDALDLGLVTHCIDSENFEDIRAALRDAEPVDAIVDGLAERVPPAMTDAERAAVRKVFGAGTVSQLFERLNAVEDQDRTWADELTVELLARSPTSLAVTLEQLSTRPPADLGDALRREYCAACQFLEGDDLYEGIRALLIDKDKNPQWTPPRAEDVDAELVESFFEKPAAGGGLELPERPKAIAAIV